MFNFNRTKKQKSKETKLSIIIVLLFACFFALSPIITQAQYRAPEPVNIYFFYGDGCPHCAEEERFLDKLKIEIPSIKIHNFETWYSSDNDKILQNIIKASDLRISGVPIAFIGDRIISGYLNDKTTGTEIRSAVEYFQAIGDPDLVGKILAQNNPIKDRTSEEGEKPTKDLTIYGDGISSKKPEIINLPIFGAMKVKNFSLPILTIVIGFLDGFNPCAMWVLLFLISMMLGMQNRKRMWAIGLSFIIASGAVYFIFMATWLNIFLFVGFIFWIRLLIGLVALVSGWYQLREFRRNKDGACKVVDEKKRIKIFTQVKGIIQEKSFVLALIGIIGLAAAVNMIELICSAGLPAIYTSILSVADLAPWQYYAYLFLYILIFMLDDMVVFVLAMVTLKMVGFTQKYVRAANLIGGIIMLIIGILMILKPEWLLFG